MKEEEKFLVPGIEKNGTPHNFRHDQWGNKGSAQMPPPFFTKPRGSKILKPTAHACRRDGRIAVNAAVFLEHRMKFKANGFKCRYNICLHEEGGYELQVYWYTNIARIPPYKDHSQERLDLFYFRDDFTLEELRRFPNLSNITLNKIDTVKVFVINKNPKTSRGTTTTVQSGTT